MVRPSKRCGATLHIQLDKLVYCLAVVGLFYHPGLSCFWQTGRGKHEYALGKGGIIDANKCQFSAKVGNIRTHADMPNLGTAHARTRKHG